MPVDRSTLDRAPRKPPPRVKLGPPAPPPRLPRIPTGGGDFSAADITHIPTPVVPGVHTIDLPPTRDARQSARGPYVNVLGPGRTTEPPDRQLQRAHQLGMDRHPAVQKRIAGYLSQITDPVQQIHAIGRAQEESILPPQLVGSALAAQHAISSGLANVKPSNVLSSFPQLDQPTPAVKARLDQIVAQQGSHVPANPTLSDYYKAIYEPQHDHGILGTLKEAASNLPRDFAMTPIYAIQGGYALGSAVNAAAHGNTQDLREIGAQQLAAVEHPRAFFEKHPFQTGLALIGGAKLAGRAGAITREAAGAPLEATPRAVPLINPETGAPLEPIGGEVPTINRGTLSTRNLTTRGAEKLSDTILARNPRLQRHALSGVLNDARAQARAEVNREKAPPAEVYQQARKGVTRAEAQRVLENEARGITPAEHAAYRGAPDPNLPPLTPAQEILHQAALGLDTAQIAQRQQMGMLSDFAAQHRAYRPAILVAAKAGDATAQRFLEADRRAQEAQAEVEGANAPHAREMADALRGLKAQHARELRDQAIRIRGEQQAASTERLPTYLVAHAPEGTLRNVGSGAKDQWILTRNGEEIARGSQREMQGALKGTEDARTATPPTTHEEFLSGAIQRVQALYSRAGRGGANKAHDIARAEHDLRGYLAGHADPRLIDQIAQSRRGDPERWIGRLGGVRTSAEAPVSREPNLDALFGAGPATRGAEAYRPEDYSQIPATRAEQPTVTPGPRALTRIEQAAESHQQSEAALHDFIQQHTASGAPQPMYVPEEPMKRVPSPYARPGGGSGVSALKRSVKPSASAGPYQAYLFEHGTYQPITDTAMMRHYWTAPRVEQAMRFAHEVSNPERGLVLRAQPGQEIPEGYVLQRVHSQANPLASELEAQSGGVAAPNKPLETLMSTFDAGRSNQAARAGRPATVPRGSGEYRLWPLPLYEQLGKMTSLNPPTGGALVASRVGQGLRNTLLYSRLAYPATNAVSNMIQSGLIAGTGASSYVRARGGEDLPVPARVQDTGTAAVNFDALGSGSLRNAIADANTPLGAVGRAVAHPFFRYTQGIYKTSVDMENWTRRATYLSKAIPEAQRMAHPEWGMVRRAIASWRPADAAVKQVLDHMAHGRTPEARAAAERSVKVVNQALGDFAAMGEHRALGVVVPFWRWTNFVRELMTETLPLHYPGRALLLYRLGSLGQEAQHQLGPLTPSLQGAIPFGGGVLSTQRINPFATIGQNLLPAQGATSLDPERAISNLSPFAQMAYTVLAHKDPVTGTDLKNQYGLPVSGSEYLRVLANQAASLVPPLRAIAPLYGGGQTNAPDTSVDIPGLVQQGPPRYTPQQPTPPAWQNALNQLLPLSYRKVDLQLMARQGDKKLYDNLRASFKKHAESAVLPIEQRLARERGVDLSKDSPARTKVRNDAVKEWKASR